MKNIQKLVGLVLALALVAPMFNSCKKGDEDPGISLSSRKGRLSRVWTMSIMERSVTTSSTFTGGSSTSTTDDEIDGEDWSTTTSFTGGSTEYKGDISEWTYTFVKDGTYTSTREYDESNTDTGGTTTKNEYEIAEKGTWNFLGGIGKETKNKEYVVLHASEIETKTTTTLTFTGGSSSSSSTVTNTWDPSSYNADVWHLNRLSGKELKIDMTLEYETSTTGSSTTIETEMTATMTSGGGSSE